jgi:ATP-dependent Lon protease
MKIDKLAASHSGDPSAAIARGFGSRAKTLSFMINYLEVGYDLSKVMFIATANNIGEVPWALRDRMELINVSGYTIEEKIEIAKKHLLPKQLKEHGFV